MKDILYRLFEHQYLGRDEARTILQNIAAGKYNDSQIASLITVYLMRNISVEELTGFREALLEMRVPVDLSEFKPIDIVGTGGDGKNTFNISTASCFVVAGAGYNVVKHGNYGATSVSGASNVMEQHGVKFTDRYRPVAPLDGSLPHCLPACAAIQSGTEGCGSDTEKFRSAQLLQHARPAGQSGNADLPVVRCVQPAIAQALQLYLSGERNAFCRCT